jgi:peptide/nickel transport system permease protein
MIRFLLRRLSLIPLALLFVHFLGFTYAHQIRPLRALRNPFFVSSASAEPLLPTYTNYISRLFELDLGTMPDPWAVQGELPLGEVILRAGIASLSLLGIALVLSIFIGVLLGILAARNDPPIVARWLTTLSSGGLAMPTFFIGSLFFAFWFLYVLWGGPGTIPLPISGYGLDSHLVVPVLVLAIQPALQIAGVTAGMLTEEFGKQYVVSARSLGHTWSAIRRRLALRNVFTPVILIIAVGVRLLVGELIVVEWLFQWPGLGNLLAQTLVPPSSVNMQVSVDNVLFLDPPVVAAVLTIFAMIFLLSDLGASLLVRHFDPRLRETQ